MQDPQVKPRRFLHQPQVLISLYIVMIFRMVIILGIHWCICGYLLLFSATHFYYRPVLSAVTPICLVLD